MYFQASTFQMAVLLQYNTSDSLTVQQLQESTQLKAVSVKLPQYGTQFNAVIVKLGQCVN